MIFSLATSFRLVSKISFVPLALMLVLSACAHDEEAKRPEERDKAPPVSANPAPDAGASMESKQVAAEANAPFVTEIRFTKKSSTLTREATSRLSKILKDAKAVGEIDAIQAYVWSDQEYPGEMAKKLPPKMRDLAVSRGQQITTYYENLNPDLKGRVKVITMTEAPEGLKASLSLGDTREKKMFAGAGINTVDTNKKAAPKASHAAIMITLKR